MTKFGWLVVFGVLLLVAGAVAIIYATLIRKSPAIEERPEAIQEIILPPVDEAAATATESPTASSTVIH